MISTTSDGRASTVQLRQRDTRSSRATTDVQVVFKSIAWRLDNRDELIKRLSLPEHSSDNELLIAGWNKWGESLADQLRGAFAFALFVASRGSIYCARDIFGLSPFYYAVRHEQAYFGATCAVVRCLLPSQPRLNMLTTADFLCNAYLEADQTFFEEVMRLPPAHTMWIDKNGVSKQRFWRMENIKKNYFPPDADAQFRNLFYKAVANCTMDETPIMLVSGGMDSSSIAAAMRSINPSSPLYGAAATFSETNDWQDRPFLEKLCSSLSIDLLEVPSDNHDPLEDMEHWLTVMDGPYLPVGHSMAFRILPMAKERGFNTLLSGHGGDEIVSYGFGRMNELAKAGKWIALWNETKAVAKRNKTGRVGHFKMMKRYLSHLKLVQLWRKLRRRVSTPETVKSVSLLSKKLERQIDLSRYEVSQAIGSLKHDERMLHEEVLSLALQPLSLEVYAICSEASGVETRCPFYDRDLLELSLSLSADWKLRDGLTRFVLRAAMGSDLPEMISQRPWKYEFGGNFMDGLAASLPKVLAMTDPDDDELCEFVNADHLKETRAKLSNLGTSMDREDAFYLWRVAILKMWLEIAKKPLARLKLQPLVEA